MAGDQCHATAFREIAAGPLFLAIRDLLTELPAGGFPDCDWLNARAAQVRPGLVSGGGKPLRFVLGQAEALAYEAHVFHTGEVPTRPHSWHDLFNALVWMAFPKSKAAINARHMKEMDLRQAKGLGGRGPIRDALTQFDECGLLVLASDDTLVQLLSSHCWEEAFWHRRAEAVRCMRFMVFGHATYDALRAPFPGLCGKAIYRLVEPDWLGWDVTAQRQELDHWLAARIEERGHFQRPRELLPMPLLGIPGVSPESEEPGYYQDVRQFRAKR